MLCGYSFAKLGVAYPSAGGPVEFLVRGLGTNLISGSFNVMLWLGYVLASTLYAIAFAGYAVALVHGGGEQAQSGKWLHPVVAVGVTVGFLLLNLLGSAAVGKAEG